MAKFEQLSTPLIRFIESQKMFFVATAPKEGKINLSPKGLQSFHVIDDKRVIWLNLTGSGNETAAHLMEDNRMTIMFNSYDENPLILRLYGTASIIGIDDGEWTNYIDLFPPHPGARQLVLMDIDMVQTSCGYGVPIMEYKEERETLNKWANKQGEDAVRQYWKDKNAVSLDGKPIV